MINKLIMVMLLSIMPTATLAQPYYEQHYNDVWCESQNGQSEHVLPDRTRVDCLTDDYALETDYASKWAESIGQSLYYARMTGKEPAVLLIVEPGDNRFVARFHNAADGLGIKLFLINKEE